jgi:hypothetical protein
MKTLLFWVGFLFLVVAALATPIAIGLGFYDWIGNDMEFKYALWEGFKSWAIMIVIGLVVGFPCYLAGAES